MCIVQKMMVLVVTMVCLLSTTAFETDFDFDVYAWTDSKQPEGTQEMRKLHDSDKDEGLRRRLQSVLEVTEDEETAEDEETLAKTGLRRRLEADSFDFEVVYPYEVEVESDELVLLNTGLRRRLRGTTSDDDSSDEYFSHKVVGAICVILLVAALVCRFWWMFLCN